MPSNEMVYIVDDDASVVDALSSLLRAVASDVPSTVTAMIGGAMDFLTKPIDESALLASMIRHSSRIGAFVWPHLNRRVCSRVTDH